MRNENELIRKTIAQLDNSNENIRLVAFEKARAMLQSRGITFAELFDSQAELESLKAKNADTDVWADEIVRKYSQKAKMAPVVEGKYIHKNEIPFWKRRHKGKLVCHKRFPPDGIMGELKILSDEPVYKYSSPEFRRLVLSFETADKIYHRYETKSDNLRHLNKLRNISAAGTSFSYTS